MDNQGLGTLFEDVMDEGIVLSDNLIKVETTEKAYPDYLRVEKHIVLSIDITSEKQSRKKMQKVVK